MTIRTLYIPAGGGFDNVTLKTTPAVDPAPGEITVRLRASSLNYHDLGVVSGAMGPKERRIPMSDGAGEVTAVGEGVREFAVGDHVVSTFFPDWLDGEPQAEGFARTPGDGIDGYAREQVTAPETWFTRAPRGWSHVEAATLTTAGLTAHRRPRRRPRGRGRRAIGFALPRIMRTVQAEDGRIEAHRTPIEIWRRAFPVVSRRPQSAALRSAVVAALGHHLRNPRLCIRM